MKITVIFVVVLLLVEIVSAQLSLPPMLKPLRTLPVSATKQILLTCKEGTTYCSNNVFKKCQMNRWVEQKKCSVMEVCNDKTGGVAKIENEKTTPVKIKKEGLQVTKSVAFEPEVKYDLPCNDLRPKSVDFPQNPFLEKTDCVLLNQKEAINKYINKLFRILDRCYHSAEKNMNGLVAKIDRLKKAVEQLPSDPRSMTSPLKNPGEFLRVKQKRTKKIITHIEQNVKRAGFSGEKGRKFIIQTILEGLIADVKTTCSKADMVIGDVFDECENINGRVQILGLLLEPEKASAINALNALRQNREVVLNTFFEKYEEIIKKQKIEDFMSFSTIEKYCKEGYPEQISDVSVAEETKQLERNQVVGINKNIVLSPQKISPLTKKGNALSLIK